MTHGMELDVAKMSHVAADSRHGVRFFDAQRVVVITRSWGEPPRCRLRVHCTMALIVDELIVDCREDHSGFELLFELLEDPVQNGTERCRSIFFSFKALVWAPGENRFPPFS